MPGLIIFAAQGPAKRLKAVALGLGLALTALTIRHWSSTFTYGYPPCSDCVADFAQFYAGAKLIWQDPSNLYSYAHQVAIQKALDPRIADSTQPFAYPPFMALIIMPLGWLPFPWSFASMTLINAGLLWLVLRLLIRKLDLNQNQTEWLLLATFCNFGVHHVFLQGQTSIIVLACLTAFMFAVLDSRQVAAGWWGAFLLFKPQLVAVPMIVLAFRRLWKALFLAGAMTVALCALSVLLVGLAGITEYFQLLKFYATSESGFGSYPERMHNLRALVQYYIPFSHAHYGWLAFVIPIAALTMWINALDRGLGQTSAYLWIANFAAAMLLTPHLYPHDLALVIVPSAFMLRLCPAPVPWFVAALLILVGVLPVASYVAPVRTPPLIPVILLLAHVASVWQIRKLANSSSSSSGIGARSDLPNPSANAPRA